MQHNLLRNSSFVAHPVYPVRTFTLQWSE